MVSSESAKTSPLGPAQSLASHKGWPPHSGQAGSWLVPRDLVRVPELRQEEADGFLKSVEELSPAV